MQSSYSSVPAFCPTPDWQSQAGLPSPLAWFSISQMSHAANQNEALRGIRGPLSAIRNSPFASRYQASPSIIEARQSSMVIRPTSHSRLAEAFDRAVLPAENPVMDAVRLSLQLWKLSSNATIWSPAFGILFVIPAPSKAILHITRRGNNVDAVVMASFDVAPQTESIVLVSQLGDYCKPNWKVPRSYPTICSWNKNREALSLNMRLPCH